MTRALVLSLCVLAVACGGRPPPSSQSAAPAPEAAAAPITPEAPAGYVPMTVLGIVPTSAGNAVLLVDPGRTVGVPVFVGGSEALSIQLRLDRRRYERPLTHDLLDAMVKELGGRIAAVRVDAIRNDVFIGTVLVQRGQKLEEFDARVSDALALAIGNRVPIYVAQRVIDESGVEASKLGIPPGESA